MEVQPESLQDADHCEEFRVLEDELEHRPLIKVVDVKWSEPYKLDEPPEDKCDEDTECSNYKDIHTAPPFDSGVKNFVFALCSNVCVTISIACWSIKVMLDS